MTEQDREDLRAVQAEMLAAARWQPSCVTHAFCVRDEAFRFTMQAWIDLDACASPFLHSQLPQADEAVVRFAQAFRAFGYRDTTPEVCSPDELVMLGERMNRVIAEGFAMQLKLRPPEGYKTGDVSHGLGDWLPVLACLKSQMGLSLAEALALKVGQAFALITAHRCNEGWTVIGETYADRDVEGE